MTKYEKLEKTLIKFKAKLIGAEQKKDGDMVIFWKRAIMGIQTKMDELTVEGAEREQN